MRPQNVVISRSMTVADHYRSLADQGRALVDELAATPNSLAGQTTAHNFIGDFELLRLAVEGRPEAKLIAAGITEYQFALYALAIGSYRHAFSSLRLSMELTLAAVHFSAHEIKYRKWTAKSEDIVWSAIVDGENGIFSNNFIGAFFPDIRTEGRGYRAMAEATYRECSEYVHGNHHTLSDSQLDRGFDAALHASWVERATTIRNIVVFSFIARYLPHLPSNKKSMIEPIALEVAGGIAAVRDAYDAAGEYK